MSNANYQDILKRVKEDLAKKGIVIPETDILGALKHGIRQSLPGLAIDAVAGTKSDFKPDTGTEKILAGVAEFAPDIVSLFATGGTSAIGSVGKAAGKGAVKKLITSPSFGLLKKATEQIGKKEVGKKLGGDAIKGINRALVLDLNKQLQKEAVKKAMPKALGKEVLGNAAEGAIYGAAFTGAKEPLKQYIDKGSVDIGEVAKKTASSAALGGAVGGGIGLASGGITGLLGKLRGHVDLTTAGSITNKVKQAHKITNKEFSELSKITPLAKPKVPGGLLDNPIVIQAKTKTDALNLKQVMLDRNLKKVGIHDDTIRALANKKDPKFIEKTLNFGEYANRVDMQTGEGVYNAFDKTLKATNEASNIGNVYLNKINSLSNFISKNKLNKEKISDLLENANLMPSSPVEMQAVKAARELLDEMYVTLKGINPDVGYLKDYLPGMRKLYMNAGVKGNVQVKKLPGEWKFSAEQRRVLDEIPELESMLRERDVIKLLGKYNSGLTRNYVEKNGYKEVKGVIERLRLRGFNKEAHNLEEWYMNNMGVNRNEYNKLSQNILANETTDYLKKAIGDFSNIEKPQWRKNMERLHNYMYNSFVGTNPKTMVKQLMQDELVGIPELGHKAIIKGRYHLKKGTYKNVLKEVEPQLIQERLNIQESINPETITPLKGMLGIAEKILTAPGKVGMKFFTYLDKQNRRLAFVSAYGKAKETGITSELLQTLNQGQKNLVLDALRTQGMEEASKKFGIIMSNRINYIYNVIDKPMLLRGEIAQYIPFTTWGRNQWSLYYGDLMNLTQTGANVSIKRAGLPLLYISALEKLTGQDLTGFTPFSTLPGVFAPTIAPPVSNVAKLVSQGKFKKVPKEASKVFSLLNLLQKLNK